MRGIPGRRHSDFTGNRTFNEYSVRGTLVPFRVHDQSNPIDGASVIVEDYAKLDLAFMSPSLEFHFCMIDREPKPEKAKPTSFITLRGTDLAHTGSSQLRVLGPPYARRAGAQSPQPASTRDAHARY